ncbi:MAG: replicative DNA helicase [Terriglobales bacterium]
MATTPHSVESILPVNVEAERSILGAILLDNFCYTQAATLLNPDDFSLDAHRRIYRHMQTLHESGRPVDYVTLTEELTRHKDLEAIGGVAYLTSLTDGLPRVQNIEHYIKIVRDKALLRGIIHASNQAIQAAIAQTENADDVLASAESSLMQLAQSRTGSQLMPIADIYRQEIVDLKKLYEMGKDITGLRTYFDELDKLTSGLQPADLVIVAARPSMGKTAFAMNIAENAAVLGKKVVAVFSLEMSKKALLLRLLCSQANVDAHKMRSGFIGRADYEKLREALARLAESELFIDDTPAISVSELRAKAQRLRHQKGRLDLIVVDYLQLMSGTPLGSGRRYENRTQEVSAISRGLKMVAKEMNVPLVALSQLSRAPESRSGDHRPQLSDLRESGSIEQDADVVAFIFRPEYYEHDPDKKQELEEQGAEIIVAKQRNGPTGKIHLRFNKGATRFENITGYDDQAPPPGPADFDV